MKGEREMLLSVKLNNCFVFNREVEFSMQANMHNQRMASNVISKKNVNVLKSAVILGPNNTGKTSFVHCLEAIKNILLNQGIRMRKCLYDTNQVCSFEIEFLASGNQYNYRMKYNVEKKEFVYEEFSIIAYDTSKNKKESRLWLRDLQNGIVASVDNELRLAMESISSNNIIIHLLDHTKFDVLADGYNAIMSFANRIDVIDMNNMPIQKTIQFLKSECRNDIVSFIKNADLYLDDFRYLSDQEMPLKFSIEDLNETPQEQALNISSQIIDMFHLASVYKGKSVPSIIYDSTGTKKISALAGYVIDALKNGRILVVDEIDNSLHFKLTRAIIAMFNNELNQKSQLICTAHDISLLDNKKLFRKEQIWFTHKDESGAYLYSLSEFTANRDGIRNTTDLIDKYKKGLFGALPEPDLFETLLEVSSNG